MKWCSLNKLILLIDMDGVICDWYGSVLRRYQITHPHLPSVPEHHIDTFSVEACYPDHCHAALCTSMESTGLFRNLEPVPGALEALKEIETSLLDNINPYLCSTPSTAYENQHCHSEKAQWVEEHLGRFWTNRLILTKDKTLVRGHILIDDHPNITGAMQPTWQQVLYNRSWNRDVDLPRFTWADWPGLRDSMIPAQK